MGVRRPRLSVRSTLTLVVSVLTAVLSIVAATIGVGAIESSLVDDVIDDEVEAAKFFVDTDVFGFDIGGFVGGLTETGLGELAVAEVTEVVADLAPTSVVDGLRSAAGVGREGELLVLWDPVVVVAVGPDGSVTPADPTRIESEPVVPVTELFDLTAEALPFPEELLSLDEELFGEDLLSAELFGLDGDGLDPSAIRYGSGMIGELEVVVAAPVDGVLRSVDRVRTLLWVATPFFVAIAAAATWFLTGRALRPVGRMTERVSEITAGTLHERVPEPTSGDEVADLAVTMNRMLDRLELSDRRRRQFVSDASHELRSPLAVLRSEAEVAQRRPAETSVEELASGVLNETDRLGTIVEDLLALARADEGAPPPPAAIDLDDIVLAEAGRARRLPIDARAVSAGRVRGRADELTRAVAHLLDNAVRHADAQVAIGLVTRSDEVTLWVDDDGPGVPEADRSQVFERFARLEEARTRDVGGAGLGLAVVASTVRHHGGAVEVETSPLGGARFVVRLPAAV